VDTGTSQAETTLGDAPTVGDRDQLARLVRLRDMLGEERRAAGSPAVARALEMADHHLFLALGYFGYSDRLFPEES
jgi:hypothetical protein